MNTKFEQIGISYQYKANNKEQALKSFRYSCNACCYRGMHIECDTCGIAEVHKNVIAILDDMGKRK